MRKILLAVLAVVAVVCGPALAATTTEYNTTFNFEQDVNGNGYFMTYKYAKMGALAMKDYVHGSGSIDSSSQIFAQDYYKWFRSGSADDTDEHVACLSMKEDNIMVYSPMTMAIGTGYYARRPLVFDSLLKEKTWVKNYRAVTSMHHEIEYAHAIDKELDVLAKEKWYENYDPEHQGVGVTQLKVTEDVTDGKIHFGVLQADFSNAYGGTYTPAYPDSFAMQTAWRDPAIEIDEDYFGTYHIEKNMTLEVPYTWKKTSSDWLPCCSGGWADMNPSETKDWSAGGIFDCTCLKTSRAGMYGLPVGDEPFKPWA